MLTTVEGIYKDGKVELTEAPKDVQFAPVLVTFLYSGRDMVADKAPETGQMIYKGMFQTDHDITDEGFKIAEFHGAPHDGLDWS